MNVEYIVVQAGGKGSRLEHLTRNKPKAIVPVNNLPMIFYLFRQFENKKFIIIADYKKDVLKKYLAAFADIDYQVVDADGTGTCGGISAAADLIKNNKPFMLIWSDLILSPEFIFPKDKGNYVGISKDFCCRWSYKSGSFMEEKSYEYGVAGLFVFENKKVLEGVPQSGEFVKWLSDKSISFKELPLFGTREFGTIEEYNKLENCKCRPFNKITIEGKYLIKEPIDEQGIQLAKKEINWYKILKNKGIIGIPNIYSYSPLKMDYINGNNIYEYKDIDLTEKRQILELIIETLNQVHNIATIDSDYNSIKETYIDKTFDRLKKVKELVPFADQKHIVINGKKCRNIFFYSDKVISKLERIKVKDFKVIHGDCTFSNILLDKSKKPVLIDPRGYFGRTLIYGDANYDWAKLYYSIVGNYDTFNLKQFKLEILEDHINLEIESNGWELLEDYFFELTRADKQTIKLLHAIIWLSLTTYAWQDYDSICGAFYNGLYYLEEVL